MYKIIGGYAISDSYPCFLRLIFTDDDNKYWVQVEDYDSNATFEEIAPLDKTTDNHFRFFKDGIECTSPNESLTCYALSDDQRVIGNEITMIDYLKSIANKSNSHVNDWIAYHEMRLKDKLK